MKLDVFGKQVEIIRRDEKWLTFYLGNEGKKRNAPEIIIPDDIPENEIVGFVSDLCHEWATAKNPKVVVLNQQN